MPPSANRWELAHELTDAWRWSQLDPHWIVRQTSPLTCDPTVLPVLAWDRSVDLWDNSWPIEKKRHIASISFQLHRAKGTLGGIKAHVSIMGGRIIKATVPPAKTFLMPKLTDEERQSFLARFPQLRIYPYRVREQDRFITTTNGSMGLKMSFVGHMFPRDTRAYDRYRREARLWDRGVETVLTYKEVRREVFDGFTAYDFEQIILPQVASGAIYAGQRPKTRIFFGPAGVRERIISLRIDRSYAFTLGNRSYQTIVPSLDPIQVEPELVKAPGVAPAKATFPTRFVGTTFLPPSTAWERIYECTYLWDPTRLPEARRRWTHIGYTRLGMPAYNAELQVEIRGKRSRYAAGRFLRGHLMESSRAPLDKVCHAVGVSKSARDKILLETKTLRPPRLGDRLKVGFRLGMLVRN
nr:phage tail protein I [Chelatococcus asaccharovorans]